LKLENRNCLPAEQFLWQAGKFVLHAFVPLMNTFIFGPSFSTIALYSAAFDSDKTFLLMIFRNHNLVSSVVPDHI